MPHLDTKPNDQRNFVHKRIIGGALGLFTGGPLAGIQGFVGGGNGGQPTGGRPSGCVFNAKDLAIQRQRWNSGVSRTPALRRELEGCGVNLGSGPFVQGNGVMFSQGSPAAHSVGADALMGQFGPALAPAFVSRTIRECLPGMILGKDGNCYNKGEISNKQRQHPRGRRPLGTPGEMAALAKAASFGRRMESTVKRMQKIGVLKKQSRTRPRPTTTHLLGPGPH